jgi:thiol:disulfide interchange protein/DsbC/DsbD-like thiol-disulfide interchange protein
MLQAGRPRRAQRLRRWLGGLLGLCLAASALAQGAVVNTGQARVELLAHAPEGLTPGKSLQLGLKIEHQPHWHTYWKNPGDSGLPTTLAFDLPAGFSVGEIAWPTPKPLPVGPLVNFGYEGTLLLPVQVSVPADFQGDALDVKLRADWLICKDVCIPEGGDFRLSVPTRAATSLHAALFASARDAVPATLPGVRGDARVDNGALVVTVQGLPPGWRGRTLSFMPELAGVIDNAAKPKAAWAQASGEGSASWQAQVPLSPQRSESPSAMAVVLVAQGESRGVQVPLSVAGPWPAPGTTPVATPAAGFSAATPPTAAPGEDLGFWLALLFAVGGGVLLNLMPCVFPVLSLKLMGFAAHADARRQLLAGGLAYTAGVVVSFVALAALLLALRAGGEQIGWGFQLQSPGFVAALAALFTLIGLNLAGVFELRTLLPGSLAAARARHPMVDSALTGVLAVAAASPCTAPFMGASLGLAATLPAAQALSIFAALGLGMALPYLLASGWPAVARLLPRPGPWMASFRSLMAFPMFATVVWLVWVLGQQVGIDGAAALLGALVALAFAAWALSSSLLAGRARWLMSATALLVLALTLGWALPALRQDARAAAAAADAGQAWQPWSAQRVQAALDEGRPVFVDFTAAWCVTCQFNKRTTLSDPQVLADLQARRVTLMRADWTRRDAAISAELARLQRNGVPVYALYAPGNASPRLLSEILTVKELRDAIGALP